MEDLTMFLAGIWGPTLIILGIGIYLNRTYYARVYRNLENEPLALFMAALSAIALGIVHIGYHNTWDTLIGSIVSLLGWALLLKGVALALAPGLVDRWGNEVASSKSLPVVAIAAGLLGLYLVTGVYL